MTNWTVGVCEAGDAHIHYTRTGGAGPPLVLLHGLTANGACWSPLARSLEGQFDVVMPDARGHGKSSTPLHGFRYDDHARDVVGLIRGLGLAAPILLGHSMGGMTATVVASQTGELISGVVLADPTFLSPERQREVRDSDVAEQHRRLLSLNEDDVIAEARVRHPHRSPEIIELSAKARLQTRLSAFDVLTPPNPEYHQLVRTIRVPVYGITRRGFGASSAPATGYSADRLGEDVVAVMSALRIDRPVLIGHSLAGEELSYVGSRYPEKVAGLVYLDAGYDYAFYDTTGKAQGGSPTVTMDDVSRKLTRLTQMLQTNNVKTARALIGELMATDLPRVRRDLRTVKRNLQSQRSAAPVVALSPIQQAIFSGFEEFTSVRVPVLAIFADPHTNPRPPSAPPRTSAQVAADDARDKENVETVIAVVERDAPGAHIVRLPHANHFVFLSNADEVLKDIHQFIQALPPPFGSALGNAVAQANDHPSQHIARQQAPVALGVVILPVGLCDKTSTVGAKAGAAVGWVRPGSTADRAGVKAGDVIRQPWKWPIPLIHQQ